VQLQATNSILEPVLSVFRFRGIKPECMHLQEGEPVTQSTLKRAETICTQPEALKVFNFEGD
jgi:hypothetical protein